MFKSSLTLNKSLAEWFKAAVILLAALTKRPAHSKKIVETVLEKQISALRIIKEFIKTQSLAYRIQVIST